MVERWAFLTLTPERIKAARLGLGLSQPQFATWIGRRGKIAPPSLSVVSRWERGNRRPGKVYGPLILAAEREANNGAHKADRP